MPPIVSSSKALARLLSGRNRALDLRSGLGFLRRSSRGLGKSERFAQSRWFSSIARIGNPSVDSLGDGGKEVGPSVGSLHSKNQCRWFLGVGDGQEEDVLSKTYEERRVMGYVISNFDHSSNSMVNIAYTILLADIHVSICSKYLIFKSICCDSLKLRR